MRQSTISRIESGACPRDEVKWRLAGALGVTVEALFPYPAIKPPFPRRGRGPGQLVSLLATAGGELVDLEETTTGPGRTRAGSRPDCHRAPGAG